MTPAEPSLIAPESLAEPLPRRVAGAKPWIREAAPLAGLVVTATALYSLYALRVDTFQPDEWYYMELSRVIAAHFPSGLWQSGIYWRGIQRIDQLVLAVPFALLRGASVYEVAHVIQALLYASTAIPVWLLARSGGLRLWARALAATVALAAPWAIVSTSFLAESAAYPAYAWALYATWRAARAPSLRSELLAVLALIAAALSRTALLAMAPVLPLAIVWQQWSWELRGQQWTRRLRAMPMQLCRRNRLVTAITVLAVLAYLLSISGALPGGGVAALTGNYGIPNGSALTGLFSRWDYYLSRMVVGTGGIAFALGLAWAIPQLVLPSDGKRHALAVICVLGIAVVLLSLVQAGSDERYVLYGAVPIGVAFAAELESAWTGTKRNSRRAEAVRLLGVVIAALAAILLIRQASWPPAQNEYDFFTYPAAMFYNRVVLTRLSGLPLGSGLAQVALAVGMIAWALVSSRRWSARLAAPVIAVVVVAVCATELGYALEKFTTSGAAAAGGPSAAQRSWLERVVPPGRKVAVAGIGLGGNAEYVPIWRTLEFWNTAIQAGVAFQTWEIPTIPFNAEALTLSAEVPSGRLKVVPNPAQVGHKLVIPSDVLIPSQTTNQYGFAAKVIASDPSLPATLIRLSAPASLQWSLAGTSEEGFMSPGQPAVATIYGGALTSGARCASVDLIGPPAFVGRWPYRISSGNAIRRGSIAAQETRAVELPLQPKSVKSGRLATVTIHVRGGVPYPNGSTVSARVASFAAGACRR